MSKKSLVDTAYEILNDAYDNQTDYPMSFYEILQEISTRLNMTAQELQPLASQFYTSLTIDGRFVNKGNNKWSLRKYEKYSDVHIDMNDAYEPETEEENTETNNSNSQEESDNQYTNGEEYGAAKTDIQDDDNQE